MSHLSRDERLLALDRALDAAREAHLAACAACRTEVEALRGVLARVRAVDVPEPSPLFWDHLAARVGDAIAREPSPAARRGWWSPRLAWAAGAVVITAAGTGYLMRPSVPPAAVIAHLAPTAVDEPVSPVIGGTSDVDLTADEGWALIAAVADDGAVDDDVLVPQVGQAELSIAALSPEERLALARELAAALGPGHGGEG